MIYVIGVPSTSLPVKVGTSEDVESRLIAIRRGSAMPRGVASLLSDWEALDVLATRPGGRPIEGRMHTLLRDHRFEGEWFSLGSSDEAITRVDDAYQRATGTGDDDEPIPPQDRQPRGAIGGGQWVSNSAHISRLIRTWVNAGRPAGDPLGGFDREQLRRVARERGLMTRRRRGLPRDEIAQLLVDDIAAKMVPPAAVTTPDDLTSRALRDYEQFCAWVRAGFTEDQALRLIASAREGR